ncbi:hypothetical protein [Streptomyces sp. NPDC088733]|uniref:hypothetical protein n=1 Tax=Streptomyces sp. NPDC088733 TaxID=3365880 RepID=UPI00382C0428
MKGTDRTTSQPSTATWPPAVPDIPPAEPEPRPEPTPEARRLLALAAEDYAQAQHPVAKIQWIEQGIAAHEALHAATRRMQADL